MFFRLSNFSILSVGEKRVQRKDCFEPQILYPGKLLVIKAKEIHHTSKNESLPLFLKGTFSSINSRKTKRAI